MAVLKATHLAKSYKSRQVVRDVSIEVSTGQIVGLLGPNGAGKTTTFYMIVGLVPLDKGDIYIDQQSLTLQPMHVRARQGIGYLPQEASIFRKLTVYQNLSLGVPGVILWLLGETAALCCGLFRRPFGVPEDVLAFVLTVPSLC
jgi:ABC-type lipopolysaccharide export system ATPase subunit